jgi:excisionase family DNA binding protein
MLENLTDHVGENSSADFAANNVLGNLVTIEETAKFLRVSRQMVYKLVCQKTLPAYHIGRRVLVNLSDVHAYLAANRVA